MFKDYFINASLLLHFNLKKLSQVKLKVLIIKVLKIFL